MSDKSNPISRRSFLSTAGVSGLAASMGVLLKGSTAQAAAKTPQSTNGFNPKDTVPAYPPRQSPKAGEKVHEFDIELDISVHEIVPGIKIHAFTYNGTYPGP